jgi:hypothetical protein
MAARSYLVSVAAAAILSVSAQDTNSSGLSARQLFFKPASEGAATTATAKPPAPKTSGQQPARKQPAAPKPAQGDGSSSAQQPAPTVPPANLGLRYSIAQPGASGVMDEVDDQKTFRSGEHFALMLESNEPAYLYVVAQAKGSWDVLFPDRGEANRIRARTRVQIPPQCTASATDECFKFDQDPAAEHMFVILSQSPEPDVDRMIREVVGKSKAKPGNNAAIASVSLPGSQFDALRTRMQLESRGIVRERVTRSGQAGENAVYVVNTSAPRVVTEIVLNHR